MHELLRALAPGAVVLDLGCGGGSFDSDGEPFTVVRIDLDHAALRASNSAQADAAKLPFPAQCFDLVICNHGLEHFENLVGSLEELGRVLKPSGVLYVAVPDVTSFSDRLYRWVARGGGHVNAFHSSHELALMIERATGLRHRATRTLCTSLSVLNRKNCRGRLPGRLLLLGGGTQRSLLLFSYVSRLLDRFLGTRASVYGWALYFGDISVPIERHAWSNVCLLCGSAHPSDWLLHDRKLVEKRLFCSVYRCPNCGTRNLFTQDERYGHLTTQ